MNETAIAHDILQGPNFVYLIIFIHIAFRLSRGQQPTQRIVYYMKIVVLFFLCCFSCPSFCVGTFTIIISTTSASLSSTLTVINYSVVSRKYLAFFFLLSIYGCSIIELLCFSNERIDRKKKFALKSVRVWNNFLFVLKKNYLTCAIGSLQFFLCVLLFTTIPGAVLMTPFFPLKPLESALRRRARKMRLAFLITFIGF